jgi:hypothetical protein
MLGFQFSTLVQMQWDRNIVPCSMQVVRNVMDDQEGQADSKGDIIENLSRWVILHVFDLMISHIRPNWTHAVLDRHRGGQEEVFFRGRWVSPLVRDAFVHLHDPLDTRISPPRGSPGRAFHKVWR